MNKLAIYSAGIFLSLASSITIATSDDLDEVTIRIFHDDHINQDTHEIELPRPDERDHEDNEDHEDREADREADHEDQQTEVHEEHEAPEDTPHEEDDQINGEPEPEPEPEHGEPDGTVIQ